MTWYTIVHMFIEYSIFAICLQSQVGGARKSGKNFFCRQGIREFYSGNGVSQYSLDSRRGNAEFRGVRRAPGMQIPGPYAEICSTLKRVR